MKRINLMPMFFVAAGISLSQVLLETHALDPLTKLVFNWLTPLVTNGLISTLTLY
jgi:hypothetical protein